MKPAIFDWSDLAFGSRSSVNRLKATFIAAPRQISTGRFVQLVKQYLPEGNIVLGVAKEQYIAGFDGQPQFRTLQLEDVKGVVDKVNASPSSRKIYVLRYFQREQKYLFEQLRFPRAVFINGSWQYSFHATATYYTLVNRDIPFEKVSPFASEIEAKEVEQKLVQEIKKKQHPSPKSASLSEQEILDAASRAALSSFDHTFQTGAALGRRQKDNRYTLQLTSFNKVVPYQTYAWHHGPLREVHFSPPNDLNYYDAVHAEVELIVQANRQRISLKNTTLFINLLPCPTCARMLCETDITEVIYSIDHSDGYAVTLLEATGKTVRRVVA